MIDEDERARRRYRGKQNKKAGEFAERLATHELHRLGFEMVTTVHTGWAVVRNSNGKIVDAYPLEPVEGDRRAVYPSTGQQVIAEVKSHDSKTLPWSRLMSHQHEYLKKNVECNAISLIVWVRETEIYVMDYALLLEAGYGEVVSRNGRRKSVSLDMATDCLWSPPRKEL